MLASFFKRFVKGFAAIAASMSSLLKKEVKINWSEDCEKSFTKLNELLLEEPILVNFVHGRPTVLHTDASGSAIASMLLQFVDNSILLTTGGRWFMQSVVNYHRRSAITIRQSLSN